MTDFFNNLTSMSWWIGVVIVGILLNLIAMYLKSPIDRLLIFTFSKYRTRSKIKKTETEVKIKNLINNKHEQILYASKTNFALGVGIYQVVTGIGMISMTGILIILRYYAPILGDAWGFRTILYCVVIFGSLMLFQGVSRVTKAILDQQLLKEAKDKESKVEDNN